ncbi:DUF4192 domain-containing protein [Streptomyces sp. NEAU-Y11]|uniref:DUF4192 domain-containing protein n=1 Tax=Streptomyces cucumeris TaxID=2962890 RepID=UPI0020C881FB|nr:DUF4192 domain-containing protein [Streptomyces sp. NEAU-Y11]MCP9205610.1 DUF4192 family protein [Streptomyces sp. NEAU-Y11]
MTRHDETAGISGQDQVTLRSPAELADALPYVLGFHPDDSIVMIALHGPRGRFGGRLRLGIPGAPEEWPEICDQLAECLITSSQRRGERPDGIVLFLCQDPAAGESGLDTVERLRPLAQRLRVACGAMEVPVYEALCLSDGRFWSYVCPDQRCCPKEGVPLALPGTSVMAAAATFAGVHVRGSLREMEARLAPLVGPRAQGQEHALDVAAGELVPRILERADCATVRAETLILVGRMLDRLRSAPAAADLCGADLRDDRLLRDDEAAAVIIGLQDRVTRDWAARWMEGPDTEAALRLWRALARRCVGSYEEHAAAPLTLAGWVAWSGGDEPAARVALSLALKADPEYLFARLLHQACNEGLNPELLRRCLRQGGVDRAVHAAVQEELARAGAKEPWGPGGAADTAHTVDTDGAPDMANAVEAADAGETAESPHGTAGAISETTEAARYEEARYEERSGRRGSETNRVDEANRVDETGRPGETDRAGEGERPPEQRGTGGRTGPGGPVAATAPGGRRRPEGRPRTRRRTGGRGTHSRR